MSISSNESNQFKKKNGRRKAARKTLILTNILVFVTGKRQAKIKEEKLDIEAALSIGGLVTRSRHKKNFQPPAAHLILDLDTKEVQCDMEIPILEADKVLTDSDATTQYSHVLDI